jgi:hypothetical protein
VRDDSGYADTLLLGMSSGHLLQVSIDEKKMKVWDVGEQKVIQSIDLPSGEEEIMDVVQFNDSQIATCSPSKLVNVILFTSLDIPMPLVDDNLSCVRRTIDMGY